MNIYTVVEVFLAIAIVVGAAHHIAITKARLLTQDEEVREIYIQALTSSVSVFQTVVIGAVIYGAIASLAALFELYYLALSTVVAGALIIDVQLWTRFYIKKFSTK
tara:strand:+ start:312 stop:629 length:318 start_codon:yes stop_codon:yes gene_type:complete